MKTIKAMHREHWGWENNVLIWQEREQKKKTGIELLKYGKTYTNTGGQRKLLKERARTRQKWKGKECVGARQEEKYVEAL